MWKKLRGKSCKIVMKDGNDVRIYFGTVVQANDSFVVEKDRFGRIHFLNTSSIERVSEHPENVGKSKGLPFTMPDNDSICQIMVGISDTSTMKCRKENKDYNKYNNKPLVH